MKKNDYPSTVHLGASAIIDDHVRLGYPTGRDIPNRELRIGDSAQIRCGAVIYEGSTIGSDLVTGHNVVIREENRIGNHFSLWSNSIVDYGCWIGDHVKIHSNCYIAQFTTIEDNAFLAPGVTIANDLHPGCPLSGECMRGPTIKRGAQIGVNTTILPFVTIGENAVIGSGAVVTKDIPPRMVAVGNPARPIHSIDEVKCISGKNDFPYRK